MTDGARSRRWRSLTVALAGIATAVLLGPTPALADPGSPVGPAAPTGPATPSPGPGLQVDLHGVAGKPSQSLLIILALTVLSLAPALLILTTSFTKIVVVLSLTRNALGLQSVPPNQVLVGLALFLSLFIMAPVLSQVNDAGVQPYLKGQKTQSVAFHDGVAPLRTFMLKQTRSEELGLFVKASKEKPPAKPEDVSLTTLVPAFVLWELKSAFIIGFVVFIPFLVIDLVVSSVADVDGHDDAAAGAGVAAVQAAAVRDGRRLGPGGRALLARR